MEKGKYLDKEELEKITGYKRSWFQRKTLKKLGVEFVFLNKKIMVERKLAEDVIGSIDQFTIFGD